MDLDCEMNVMFAKRLQKQQMRSPVSTLITKKYNTTASCKRRLEIDDQDSESEKDVQNISEIVGNGVNNKLVENSFTTNNVLLMDSVNNNCTMSMIEKKSPTLFKDLFCDTQTESLGIEIQNCEINPSLRLHNSTIQEVSSAADRYIPSRVGSNWRDYIDSSTDTQVLKKIKSSEEDNETYTCILKNELFGDNIEEAVRTCNNAPTVERKTIFKFSSNTENNQNNENHSYSLSPVGAKSQQLLRSPCKTNRKISKVPFKVLDAPELQNDFYLNLVDWSSQNMLGVGLGNSAYLWSANTSQVTRLCDLTSEGNSVTSVSWNDKGNYLALGTFSGAVQIWDVAVSKKITQFIGHTARVGSSAWNGSTLATGSRDKMIFKRDIRLSRLEESPCCIYESHRQEVCGLKFSPDGQYLASGGNDNQLFVWSNHSFRPFQNYSAHTAAVKAISWSPHQHGLLASGGGTADRCIRFWNTLTGQPIQSIDTGSQVCNIAWSKKSCELVSTHGYSKNQIVVWKYPSLKQIAKLSGQDHRFLYLAMSPDGESIVTGAGDETLRFWNIFSKTSLEKENKSVLNIFSTIR